MILWQNFHQIFINFIFIANIVQIMGLNELQKYISVQIPLTVQTCFFCDAIT